ncbi:proline iminopeptidase-family hydrolase [Lentilactobacillus farraginis]|uniref:Proline iminopeptidase n=1 Tax=Lentilactobacillus farraginis DSM 18382 = JCM 14108 TaxID=1423743 RepID=X0PBS2_9LACO|nr:proline iminopeptidase-family hydrolase [Lentilactobacillus farraginis]KRM11724.1 proline iminopeptidase (pip) [Lentilactobacillus farraginis DSM 18382 = JCM 14108]GAF37709.1 proline iminopeptidase [Lentilactobacillus farraginis DSM 18382 = JCM 14108]
MKNGTHIIKLDNGYSLWTHTWNSGGRDRLLCLHGGPGDTHEVYEQFGSELKDLDIEVNTYDQLGSWYSDTPDWDNPDIRKKYLNVEYYVNEIEEVRQKLGLDKFYLAGHSWGGMISMIYARRHPEHLKGLIIISMIDNIADYIERMKLIRKQEFSPAQLQYMDDIERRGEFSDATYRRYIGHLYDEYIHRRKPAAQAHVTDIQSKAVYNYFQGDNEFVVTGDLDAWDFRNEIKKINVPTQLMFADHETMPLQTAKRMADDFPHARLAVTPGGGHNHMIDNPDVFFTNLKNYFKDVRTDKF